MVENPSGVEAKRVELFCDSPCEGKLLYRRESGRKVSNPALGNECTYLEHAESFEIWNRLDVKPNAIWKGVPPFPVPKFSRCYVVDSGFQKFIGELGVCGWH